jgi:predicted DNA-binding protein
MRHKILNKLRKAGAVSKAKAVTIREAALNYQEQMWLDYFAGAFLGKIKKTDDRRYYVQ